MIKDRLMKLSDDQSHDLNNMNDNMSQGHFLFDSLVTRDGLLLQPSEGYSI